MERFWMRLVRLFQCVDKSFSTINKSAICTAYVNAIPQLSDLEQLKSMFFALKSPLMITLWAELLMLFRRSLLDSVGCVGIVSSLVATVPGFVTGVTGLGPLNFGVGPYKLDIGRSMGLGQKNGVGWNFGESQKKKSNKVVLNILLFNNTLKYRHACLSLCLLNPNETDLCEKYSISVKQKYSMAKNSLVRGHLQIFNFVLSSPRSLPSLIVIRSSRVISRISTKTLTMRPIYIYIYIYIRNAVRTL